MCLTRLVVPSLFNNCQGVGVASNGPCPNDPPMKSLLTYDEDGVIDLKTMNRFKNENFKFTAKRNFIPYSRGDILGEDEKLDDEEDVEEEQKANGNGNGKAKGKVNGNGNGNGNAYGNGNGRFNGQGKGIGKKIRATRVTEDGMEYVADLDEDELTPLPDVVEPLIVEEGNRRRLGIYQDDTRTLAGKYNDFPNRIVGELDYGDSSEDEGGCTGTVLFKDTILTAGKEIYLLLFCLILPTSVAAKCL